MKVPEKPRVISFLDAQWFLRASKFAFDTQLPNINPRKLTAAIAKQYDWDIAGVNMYVDIPDRCDSLFWSQLWAMRCHDLSVQSVNVKSTVQRTRQAFSMDGGTPHKVNVRSDLDTAINITMDVVTSVAFEKTDVILLFTSENKYLELAEHIKALARNRDTYLKVVSAFPYNAERAGSRYAGIDRTDWYPISWELFRECTDFVRKPTTHQKPMQDSGTTIGDRVENNQRDSSEADEAFTDGDSDSSQEQEGFMANYAQMEQD